MPVCVLQSKKDSIIDPLAANIIYRDVSSKHREIHWLFESGHEMGQDLERDTADKTSSVHFMRFELSPSMIAAMASGARLKAGIDHAGYPLDEVAVEQHIRDSLAADLKAPTLN